MGEMLYVEQEVFIGILLLIMDHGKYVTYRFVKNISQQQYNKKEQDPEQWKHAEQQVQWQTKKKYKKLF
jgi:hypothetical protein